MTKLLQRKTLAVTTCVTRLYPMCCKECAKTEGEPCGGELGFSGTCEPGLSCQQPGLTPTEGICRPILLEDVENT
ncbi:hypothetical protein QE152_g11047 [Popillia japonica]|uniref:IGFBP N-terminal domain-containing protein n=1 Tax=Popillia japonica TaxID=7064 RepID=A0AAW1LTG5_POPJA